MNIKLTFLPILIALCSSAYGQALIHGKITNSEGKPLPTAIISQLDSATRSTIKTQSAAADGTYSIASDGKSFIVLQVAATGYNGAIREVAAKDFNTDINFTLLAEKTLKEVAITSRKPVIEEKVDRTIFNVENSIAATGGDAIDALKSTPGVVVQRNEISIAGKGTVGVMINGRLQQVSGADLIQLLHSIPSGNLSKIEVINNPPARYDAEGNSGLINLVMKKNMKNGLRGSATATYLQNSVASPELSTSLNYKKDKLNINCNINGGVNSEKYTNRTSSYYPPQRWDQTFIQYEYDKNATAQVGADYRLNDKQTLGFQFTERGNFTDGTDNAISNNFDANNKLDSVIRTHGDSHEYSAGKHALNLNYEWQIDSTGKKLNVDADYYTQHSNRTRSFFTQGFTPAGDAGPGTPNKMSADPGVTVRSVKADVEWPLKAFNFSYGGKASFVENTSDNIYYLYADTNFVTDPTRTNDFQYHEQTQALYINGQRSLKKFDVQVGLRGEHTFIETYSPTTGQRNTTEYTKLFPSAYVQYKVNDDNVTGIVFSRRINRPWYNSLNPFRFYLGPNFYIAGNPELRPSFTNSIEWSYRWKKKYSLRVYARQTDNYFDRIYKTDPANDATILTRANMGTASNCGSTVSGQNSITKWWDVRGSFNVIYQDYSLNLYNTQTHLTDVFEWLDISNTFYLDKKKNFSAEIFYYYYTPRLKDYKHWSSMATIDINLRWMLLDKNLIIALHLEDLMATAYWQQTNIITGTSEYSYDNARGGRLSVTYKFGNKNVKVRNTDHSNEEIQRASQ